MNFFKICIPFAILALNLVACEKKPGPFDAKTMKEQWVGASFNVKPKLAPTKENANVECKYISSTQALPSYDYDMSEYCGAK